MCNSSTDELYAVIEEIKSESNSESNAECNSESEKVVAYCCVQKVLDEGEILRIAVAPEMRRKGIARDFLVKVIEKMKSAGCESVFLEVRQENLPAIGLYKNTGFEELYIRKNYYGKGQDAVIFKLQL